MNTKVFANPAVVPLWIILASIFACFHSELSGRLIHQTLKKKEKNEIYFFFLLYIRIGVAMRIPLIKVINGIENSGTTINGLIPITSVAL